MSCNPSCGCKWASTPLTSYVQKHGIPSGPDDYAKHRFIGPESRDIRAAFYRWMAANIPAEAITFRQTDSTANYDAIKHGLGIGFLPTRSAREEADLVQIMAPQPEWDSHLWIVTHVDLHRSLKVQSFLNVLKEHAANWSCT